MIKSVAVFLIVYWSLAVLFSFLPLPDAVARYSLYAYAVLAGVAAMLAGRTFFHDWQEEATPIQSLFFTIIAFVIVLFAIPLIFAVHFIYELNLQTFVELLQSLWQNSGDATILIRSYLEYLDTSQLLRLALNAVVFFLVIQQSFVQTIRRKARQY